MKDQNDWIAKKVFGGCCIFQLANRCFALHSLVNICLLALFGIFFQFLPYFDVKGGKWGGKEEKTLKNAYS